MEKYLHGFDKKEQTRLLHQAQFLEPYVYSGIDLEFKQTLLEVGCGVGAQTKILLRRFPGLTIDCVDFSDQQLATAKKNLKQELQQKKVRIFKQDAQKLNLNKKYDAAFLCWFLEHIPDPVAVLKRVKNHLKPGGKIYCTEPFNQTLFLDPYSPNFLNYWFQFNDYQWTHQGHPFVGAQLGNLLKSAGFKDISCDLRTFHFDSREPEKRAAFTDYFFDILLSAEETLLAERRVSKELIENMKKEVQKFKQTKNSVFFDAFMRATAKA